VIITVLLDFFLAASTVLAIAGFAAIAVSRRRRHSERGSQTVAAQARNALTNRRSISLKSISRAGAPLIVAFVVAGVGAGAAALRPTQMTATATTATITKLKSIGIFNAAEATFQFNFSYQARKSFLFIAGETIHVVGTGTDVAEVNFSHLADSQVIRGGPVSIVLVLPKPFLGTPVVNFRQTELTESGGLLTVLAHLLKSDPKAAVDALGTAQIKIAEAAAASALIDRAEMSTRGFLSTLLRRLGFNDITIKFV
jgi:hypothetical protein